jgi:hypothetical protein
MSTRLRIVVGSLAGAVAIQLLLMAWQPRSGAAAQAGLKIGGTLDVASEDCSHTTPAGVPTFVYAAHAYPGMSAAQLSQVRTIGHAAQTGVVSPGYRLPSYPFAATEGFIVVNNTGEVPTVYVRDGVVAVLCGAPAGPWFDSVTFTLVE